MDKLFEIKKGQLRVTWPFVKRTTFEAQKREISTTRNERDTWFKAAEHNARRIESLQQEIIALKKTMAKNIHLHVGPQVIHVVDQHSNRDITSYAMKVANDLGPNENISRGTNGVSGEVTLAARSAAFGYTCPTGQLLSMPERTLRHVAEGLVDFIMNEWKKNPKPNGRE